MKIKNLILIMGFSVISACASNEVNMEAEENNAETAKDEVVTTSQETKADAQAEAESAKEEVAQATTDADNAVSEAAETQTEAASSSSANRQSTCEHNGQTRIITVVYDNDATDTVCEVTYEKSSGIQTLWTANSDRDYCMDKATAFVQKQEGWGWTCSNLE